MHLFRVIATAGAVVVTAALAPVAVASNAPDQPAGLHFVRGAVGHFGGFAGHGRGFRSGFARGRNWHYRPWRGGYWRDVYPYAYVCPYPYNYAPYCTWPNG